VVTRLSWLKQLTGVTPPDWYVLPQPHHPGQPDLARPTGWGGHSRNAPYLHAPLAGG
jgi:hypothetical protein